MRCFSNPERKSANFANLFEINRMDKLKQDDPTAASRKRDHIELAFQSQVTAQEMDRRFSYEPLLAAHPQPGCLLPLPFLGKSLRAPMWVSSMTGGTEWARIINHNLAQACREFGLGMGLGSCRSLLHDDLSLADFNVRPIIGDDLPLYANLGIAQVEQLLNKNGLQKVDELISKLSADGLIIHVNPLQEWLQPEGDRFVRAPLHTISDFLEKRDIPVIVKEVGQGMGYESLKALLQLPIQALDFAASGGTNFAMLELLRSRPLSQEAYNQLAFVGHTAEEMVQYVNELVATLGEHRKCNQIIISGGIRHFLDGYYLMHKLTLPAVYGQASSFLKHARGDYSELKAYVETQVRGLEVAHAFLKVK